MKHIVIIGTILFGISLPNNGMLTVAETALLVLESDPFNTPLIYGGWVKRNYEPRTPPEDIEHSHVLSTMKAVHPIKVDGQLNEQDWSEAESIRGLRYLSAGKGGRKKKFYALEETLVRAWMDDASGVIWTTYTGEYMPEETPDEETVVKVLYDAKGVYFGFLCNDPQLLKEKRKDKELQELLDGHAIQIDMDINQFYIDDFKQQSHVYFSSYSADPFVKKRAVKPGSIFWEAGEWQARTYIGDGFWSMEVFFPYSGLRLTPDFSKDWLINFTRMHGSSRERTAWIPITGYRFGSKNKWGLLKGIDADYNDFFWSMEKIAVDFWNGDENHRMSASVSNHSPLEKEVTITVKAWGDGPGNVKYSSENFRIPGGNTSKIHLNYASPVKGNHNIAVQISDPETGFTLCESRKYPVQIHQQVQSLSMEMGINEYEQAAFTLMALHPVSDIRIEPGDLKSGTAVLPAENIQVCAVNYLNPVRRGEYYAASSYDREEFLPEMIEEVHGKLNLNADEGRHIWIKVNSHDVEPGTYEGTIRIKTSQHEITIPLQVIIWPVRLPETLPVLSFPFGYLPWPESLARKYGAVLKSNRINVVCFEFPYVEDGQIAWRKYHFKERLRLAHELGFKVEIRADNVIDRYRIGSYADNHGDFKEYIRQIRDCLHRTGFSYTDYCFLPTNEPRPDDPEFELFRLIRAVDPDIRLMANLNKTAINLSEIRDYVDYWCLATQHPVQIWNNTGYIGKVLKSPEQVDFLRRQQQGGDKIFPYHNTWRIALKPERVLEYRSAFWYVWKYQLDGFSSAVTGRIEEYPVNVPEEELTRGQGGVLNPAEEQPLGWYLFVRHDGHDFDVISSKRLEAWRDGAEDYLYLYVLKDLVDRCRDLGFQEAANEAENMMIEAVRMIHFDSYNWELYNDIKRRIAGEIIRLQKLVGG